MAADDLQSVGKCCLRCKRPIFYGTCAKNTAVPLYIVNYTGWLLKRKEFIGNHRWQNTNGRLPSSRLHLSSSFRPSLVVWCCMRESSWIKREEQATKMISPQQIRNFCIIAHIDHGKSTLADRLLQLTNTVSNRDMKDQFLDSMDLERERGITIKLQTARMNYRAPDGNEYILNLIDTPGHVDFSYEVSRSLVACEGAILVVDASQGVEAQTLANVYLASESGLEIIPVLNKVDLPSAEPLRVKQEIEQMIGLDTSNCLEISAKTGKNVEKVLEYIVKYIPPPKDRSSFPLRALIFDSYYDAFRGVVVYFRVFDGILETGKKIRLMNSQKDFESVQVGVLAPHQVPVERLISGEVGYLVAGIKTVQDARVGDTITLAYQPADCALPGYKEAKPMVFCGLYPSDADQFEDLRDALEKLKLNDSSLSYEPESSSAMGFGFRCGFLGLLHMEIVCERLSREYGLDLVTTSPSVGYYVYLHDNSSMLIQNPCELPEPHLVDYLEEPYVRLEIITPTEYVGPLMELTQSRRGIFQDMKYITATRTSLVYELPLAELVTNFFDLVKSRSRGYASMEYQWSGYRRGDLVKLEVAVNGEKVDALCSIVHRDKAYSIARALTERLKELIPRQQFRIPVQGMIGNRVIASEHIPALRKDVLAKCYGGDISRKKKLLKKQAEGKKRMKAIGKVDVPQEAFRAMLSLKQTED
jgi:GTP-binding protein LepA